MSGLDQTCTEARFDQVQPGEVLHLDFRNKQRQGQPSTANNDGNQTVHISPSQTATAVPSADSKHTNSTSCCGGIGSNSSSSKPLRLVQWNIERGYQLPLIIEQLQDLDADIISLQEVDWGCERSGCADTGAAIARALGLNYIFVCEFQELHSPLRDARSQGGGVHGNAILSKFDFQAWNVIEHTHHPIDWELPPQQQPHPLAAREPRKGRRLSLAADVATLQGSLRVYCCHLEVFCGILSRVWQFSDILKDARAHHHQQQQQLPSQQQLQQQQQCHQVILGDLNTMAHSVARLSPNYCCDRLRWGSLGCCEAAWWQRNVLAVTDPCPVNKYLLKQGLPEPVAAAAVNPGFLDPFDVKSDVTLDNPKYRLGPLHLMAGKLDWVLLRGCKVLDKAMGNADYSASDHKWLMVDVQLL